MRFSLKEILEATDAKIILNKTDENDKFTFSTDTRSIKKGEIYLPLKGENFDGEKFIENALDAGAAGYFTRCIDAKMHGGIVKKLSPNIVLYVENTLTAYLQLANFYRKKINPKTVVITGSSGKTTTKEMAFCVSSEKFKTHKSELNFNNEIGFCKTVLSMPEDTQVLILEAGMRGLGEIELISKYAEPDIAIIANVGTAHIGRLGSRENIAKAKCEIVIDLRENGTLIAHDDELIKKEKGKREKEKAEIIHSIYFSLNNTKIIKHSVGYIKFVYKEHEYELNIEGDYNVQNSLATIEMGLKLQMSEDEIACGLKKYTPIEKRWEIQDIRGFKIINDSYNANPDSMLAVIKTSLELYKKDLLLVLGDMGELGENELNYHKEIGDFLVNNLNKNVNVITVGKLANEISKTLTNSGFPSMNFTNTTQVSRYILDNMEIGTTIILKASRSMKFEEIIENLKGEK